MFLSSLSDSYPSSSSSPATLDNISSCGKPNGTGVHDGSHKVGCSEDLSGDGTIDGAQDSAQDGTQDGAANKTRDGASECI